MIDPARPQSLKVTMCNICDNLKLETRYGPRPRTNPRIPHVQIDQNAPAAMRDRLISIGAGFAGARVGRSGVSLPETSAFLLAPELAGRGAAEVLVAPGEFAHGHAACGSSLHMTLPQAVYEHALSAGWGEPYPLVGQFGFPPILAMIYGPRDERELALVACLLAASYNFATGRSLHDAGASTRVRRYAGRSSAVRA